MCHTAPIEHDNPQNMTKSFINDILGIVVGASRKEHRAEKNQTATNKNKKKARSSSSIFYDKGAEEI